MQTPGRGSPARRAGSGARPGSLVSPPTTAHSGEGMPQRRRWGKPAGEATETEPRPGAGLPERAPLCWLFQRDTVQAPGRPGSRVRRLLLLFCFWERPPSAPLLPPTRGSHKCAEHFPPSSAEIHPKVKDQRKGLSIIKEAVFISQGRGDENKQNKRGGAPPPRPPPHENNHPFYRNFTAKSLNVIIIIISLLEIV